jgi:hypothetical protein
LIFFSILSPNFFICQIWSLFFIVICFIVTEYVFCQSKMGRQFCQSCTFCSFNFSLVILIPHHQLRQSSRLSSCVSFCVIWFSFFFLIFLGKKWVIIVIQIMIELRMMIIFMMIQESLQDLINIRGPFHECRHQVDDLHILQFIIMLGRNNCKLFNCKILYKCLFACNNLKRGRSTSYPKWD